MKVTSRLPVHQKYAETPLFVEMRYFRFAESSHIAAALFGLFEELRLPHHEALRSRLRQYIAETAMIRRKEVLYFLLEPRVKEECMLAVWNCGDDAMNSMIQTIREFTGYEDVPIEYLLNALKGLFDYQAVTAEEVPATNPLSTPTIYWDRGEQQTVLLYPGRSLDSFFVTHCGHVYAKAGLFKRMREAMGGPRTQSEFSGIPFKCAVEGCSADIRSEAFEAGKQATGLYPIPWQSLHSDLILSQGEGDIEKYLRQKPADTQMCRYCGIRNGTFSCHEMCLICRECALVAYCSYGYCSRCPACGEKLSKDICMYLEEQLGKCVGCTPLPHSFCDYCFKNTPMKDIVETSYMNRRTLICSVCYISSVAQFQSLTLASKALPIEESKEHSCQCEKCGNLRRIEEFTFYLSGQHSCLICDLCYHSLLFTDNKKPKCPRCPQAYTSYDAKRFTNTTAATQLPSIWCAVCLRQNHQPKFSVGMKLSHWWKCRICDDCLVARHQQGIRICTTCSSLYSFQDLAVLNQAIPLLLSQSPGPSVPPSKSTPRVSSTGECQMCGRESATYSIMKALKHDCSVCDNCIDALYDINWVPACPNCHNIVRAESLKQIHSWKKSRNCMPEMNTPRTCSICSEEKPRKEMLKSERLHHTCLICDICLLTSHSLTACPKCSVQYNPQDQVIMGKLLERIPVKPKPQPSPRSANQKLCTDCGSRMDQSRPNCPKACLCSLCLLLNYIFTNSKNCPQCNTPIEGQLPEVVNCTGCSRPLSIHAESSEAVSGICENQCILCCFCITMTKDQANCSVCKATVESIEVKQIVKWQKGFKLGCYCGKDKGTRIQLACGCTAHTECWPKLKVCRLCRHEYKKKSQLVRLNSYLS